MRFFNVWIFLDGKDRRRIGNSAASYGRGNSGASGRCPTSLSRESGGIEAVLEQVAPRCRAGVLDDSFGAEAGPGIVVLDLIGVQGATFFSVERRGDAQREMM